MKNNQKIISKKEELGLYFQSPQMFSWKLCKSKLQGAANINQIPYESQHIEARLPPKSSLVHFGALSHVDSGNCFSRLVTK